MGQIILVLLRFQDGNGAGLDGSARSISMDRKPAPYPRSMGWISMDIHILTIHCHLD